MNADLHADLGLEGKAAIVTGSATGIGAVGVVLNVACGVAKIPMEQGARGVAPFVLVQISLLLLVAFPLALVLVPLGYGHPWFG